MKQAYVFLILTFLLHIQLNSQEIVIQPPLIDPHSCTELHQFYTGSIMNFSDEPVSGVMTIEIAYQASNQQLRPVVSGVLSGNGGVSFGQNTTVINNTNYDLIYSNRSLNFLDENFRREIAVAKCVPPGAYTVCLTLVSNSGVPSSDDINSVISRTCYERVKESLSNIFLVSPFDGTEVALSLPLFTWTPVTPIGLNGSYFIELVEVFDQQTSFQAFRSNPIFYRSERIINNFHQYPIEARQLNSCSTYAWRVGYRDRVGFIDNNRANISTDQDSEIWEFDTICDEELIEEEEELRPAPPKEYLRTSTNNKSQYHIQQGDIMLVEINNPYQYLGGLTLILTDPQGEKKKYQCCTDVTINKIPFEEGIQVGLNYLELDLSNYGLSDGEYYTIEFVDFKQSQYLNFQYLIEDE